MKLTQNYSLHKLTTVLFILHLIVAGCSSQRVIEGSESVSSKPIEGTFFWHPKTKNLHPNFYEYVRLNPDSTAEYSFWADIRVKKHGTWSVNNDTVYLFIKNHEKKFIQKNDRLSQSNGIDWIKE